MGTDREDPKPLTPPPQQEFPDPLPERERLQGEPADLEDEREEGPKTKIVAGHDSTYRWTKSD